MSFNGANVTCASAVTKAGAVLTGHVLWAEYFPSGIGQTVQSSQQADCMMRVSVSADTWVTYGIVPDDPSNAKSRRYLIRAGYDENFFVHVGCRVAMALV